jgi:negative regulator of sigma E activity
MRSFLSKSSLYLLAVVVLLGAFLTWSLRRQGKLQARLAALQTASSEVSSDMREQRATQQAIALLSRALLADTQLTFTATTETWANYGGKEMKTQARITRAPHKLSIAYLDGDKQGLHAGFSERWFWRQDGTDTPMKPFASMQRDTTELATKRFATLLENYGAQWKGRGTVDSRAVDIVELWPFEGLDGAAGPGKRLSIDRETNLVLKVETFNHQRQPVMRTELRDVQINPAITPDTFKAPQTILASAQTQPWMAQDMGHDAQAVKNKIGVKPPRVAQDDLPPGFKLETVGMQRCPSTGDKPQPCDYAALSRYTDGLNTLTLFAMKESKEAQKAASQGDQSCQFGPGALVMRDMGDFKVIAVGDLPQVTLRRVLANAQVEVPAAEASSASGTSTTQ